MEANYKVIVLVEAYDEVEAKTIVQNGLMDKMSIQEVKNLK